MTGKVLHALLRRASHRGLVIAREGVLTDELRITPEELKTALRELENLTAIEILSSPPFIALKLLKWPGHHSGSVESAQSAYSYQKLLQTKQSEDSYRRGELAVEDGLLHEILETLGETDPESFRKAIEHYAPHVIRTALNRVRRAKSIRKNRTALFRHLLPRIAKESQPSA